MTNQDWYSIRMELLNDTNPLNITKGSIDTLLAMTDIRDGLNVFVAVSRLPKIGTKEYRREEDIVRQR